VLGAVRARQQELQHIEQSIAELTQLFQDVETLVLRSEPVAQQSAYNAEAADEHINQGIRQIEDAQVSAKRRRKLKWWCLGVSMAIVIVVAIIILAWLKATGRI
jgi:syntaxin 1B/2/3